MGMKEKFAYVYNESPESITPFLADCQSDRQMERDLIEADRNSIGNLASALTDDDMKNIRTIIGFLKNVKSSVAKFDMFASSAGTLVYSDYFNFHTAPERLQRWFYHSGFLCAFVANLDDDAYRVDIMRGEKFTSLIVGDGLAAYDLNEQKFDTAVLSELFAVTQEEIGENYSSDANLTYNNFLKFLKIPILRKGKHDVIEFDVY